MSITASHSTSSWPVKIDFSVFRQFVRGYSACECAEEIAVHLASASIDHEEYRNKYLQRQQQQQQQKVGGGNDSYDDDYHHPVPSLVEAVCHAKKMNRGAKKNTNNSGNCSADNIASPSPTDPNNQQHHHGRKAHPEKQKQKKKVTKKCHSIPAAILGSLVQSSDACRGHLLEEVNEQYLIFRQLEASTDDFLNDPRSFLEANVDAKASCDRKRILEEYYVIDPVFYRCSFGVKAPAPAQKLASQVTDNISRTPAPVMLMTAAGGSEGGSAITGRGAAANRYILRQSQNLIRVAVLLETGYGPGGTFSKQFPCVDAISENFQLPSSLAWQYATLVFAAQHRLRDTTATTSTGTPAAAAAAAAAIAASPPPATAGGGGAAAAIASGGTPVGRNASSPSATVAVSSSAAEAAPSSAMLMAAQLQQQQQQQRNQLVSFLVVPVDVMQSVAMLLMSSLCTDSKLFVDEKLQEEAGNISRLLADSKVMGELSKMVVQALVPRSGGGGGGGGGANLVSAAGLHPQQGHLQPTAENNTNNNSSSSSAANNLIVERILRVVARACHAFSGGGLPTIQLVNKNVILGFCVEIEKLFLASTTTGDQHLAGMSFDSPSSAVAAAASSIPTTNTPFRTQPQQPSNTPAAASAATGPPSPTAVAGTSSGSSSIQHQNILSGMGHHQILAPSSVFLETRRALVALKRAVAAPSVTALSVGIAIGGKGGVSFGHTKVQEAAARILDLVIAMCAMMHSTVM